MYGREFWMSTVADYERSKLTQEAFAGGEIAIELRTGVRLRLPAVVRCQNSIGEDRAEGRSRGAATEPMPTGTIVDL